MDRRTTDAPAVGQAELEKRKDRGEDKVTRMGTAPIGRLMLEFSIPAVAAVVLNSLYNVIDSIFLGQAMGEIGLAATQVAFPIMTIVNAFAILAGNGGNSLAAILLGEGRKDDAERALGNSVTVMIIVSIAAAIYATFWIDPLLVLVGATDVTLPYARTFIQIIIYGMMICNISFGVNNFIRTAGAPNLALWTTVVGTVVCVILNYLFVLVFGWGVAGSASATIIGQAVTAVIVLWYFVSSRSSAPFKLHARNLAIDPKICKRLIELGLAPFGLQAAMAVTQVISNMLLASLGAADPIGVDGALASIGVVSKITGVVFFPALGIAIAAQPILGFNTGARKYRRVLRTLYVALGAATAILTVFFVLIHVFPEQIISVFGIEALLMSFAVWALIVQTALIPLISVQVISSNYFQATGQPLKSAFLSLTRQLIFLLPAFLVTPTLIPSLFPGMTPLMGYCFSFPIADGLSVLLSALLLVIEVRKQHRRIAEAEAKGAVTK